MIKKASKQQVLTMLLSLLLATMLWMSAMSSSDPVVYKKVSNIPIELLGTDELSDNELVIISELEPSVTITLYGRSGAMDNVHDEDIKAYVDVATIRETGTYKKDIVISGLSDGVNILHQSTKSVNLSVDAMVTKTFPIQLNPTGNVASSSVLGTYYSETTKVKVISNQKNINRIAAVKANFSVKGADKDFTAKATLVAVDENGKEISGVRFNTESVLTYVSISTASPIDVRPITGGSTASGYKVTGITVIPSKVEVIFPSSMDLEQIKTLPIDLDGQSKSFETDIALALPNGVTLKDEANATVSVRVEIEPLLETSYTFSTINIDGQKSEYTYEFENFENITVTLTGPKSTIEKLVRTEVVLSIDVTKLQPGTHTVKLICTTPENISVKSYSQKNITITIREK